MSSPELANELIVHLKDSTRFKSLQVLIQYQFTDYKLMATALTHSSFVHESDKNYESYERLEFLGDSVLQLIVTQELVTRFPYEKEGILSKLRSSIVNEDSLTIVAKKIGLGELVFLGRGEKKSKGRNRSSLLCDIFESFIGALYLDSNFETCRRVVLSLIETYLPGAFLLERLDVFDPKTKLQEMTLKNFKKLPEYLDEEVCLENGVFFRVSLDIGLEEKFSATDISKKKAQRMAAQNALYYLETNSLYMPKNC